jgi:hypothetical protein
MDLNNVENYGLHLQPSQLLITRKLKAVNIIYVVFLRSMFVVLSVFFLIITLAVHHRFVASNYLSGFCIPFFLQWNKPDSKHSNIANKHRTGIPEV